MQRSDAPGSAPIKQRRQRKVAGLGPAAEQAQRFQELGDALDALVRAVGAADALAVGLSRRTHALWCGDADAVIEWHATELRCDGRLVLAADVQRGRFLLPAHAAGLRLLAIRAQSVPDDLLRLAAQLAALERGQLALDAFADWLWRGGACGFDALQGASTTELGQLLRGAERTPAELWTERSQQAVASWNDLAWLAAQSLPQAVLAERYAAPLADYEQRALLDGALTLGLAEAQALRARADDPHAWARAEIELLTARPELRGNLPRAHVAYQLLALIEHGGRVDPGLLDTLAVLDAPRGDADRIDVALLGAAYGRALLAHGFEPDALHALVDRADVALCDALLRVLVDAAASSALAGEALSLLLQHWGPSAFFSRVAPKQFAPVLGASLLGTALAAGTDPARLAPVLEQLPIASALYAAAIHPPLLGACAPIVERRIRADPPQSGPLLADFAGVGPVAARIVGKVLLSRQGSGFGPEALKAALHALSSAGLGAEFVLPLWEARTNATHVRLAALSALSGVRPLLAQVFARRVANLLEPPAIREALEELRWKAP